MTRTLRRTPFLLILIAVLGALTAPAWATPLSQAAAQQTGRGPRIITGSYRTTNPLYPMIGAQTGIVLYDMTGQVHMDFDFQSPPEAQVLGTLNGDIVSGTYTLTLPTQPQGVALDFDGDASTPPAVQVFSTATYVNLLGDEYINRGEMPLDLSARLEPMTYHIIGGHVLVWAPRDGEQFPAGRGADGAAFTDDDPLMRLPAGWSVIALDTDPFTIIRDETVEVPVIESFGGLNDYSALSYLDAWNTLYQRTRETYPFTPEKRLDWDAIYAAITPLVKRVASDLDFHLVMIRFGSLIPDTHIGYVSIPVVQNFLMGGVGISRTVVTDDEQVVIASVAPDSPADQAGIRAGDVLVAVDGQPALDALDETPLLLSSASTRHARRYLQAAIMLQGPVGSRTTLVWRGADGAERRRTFTRTLDMSAFLEAFGGGVLGDVIAGQMLDSGVGYIKVRSFAQEVSTARAQFAAELAALIDAGARGIIVDLRDNSGGLVQLAMAMAGHFFPDYKRLLDFYYADGAGGFAYRGFVEVLPGAPYYEGPVAVLVNEMTGSAADLFAHAMQTDQRALIVGFTPSSGSTGEVGDGQYVLPGGLQMQIPTGRPIDPATGRTLIEGTGVIPDVRVPLTRESVISPADEVLQAAEAALLGG